MSLFIVSGGTGNCTGGRWTVVGNVSIPNTRVLNVSYDYIALYGSLVLEGPEAGISISVSINNITGNRFGIINSTGLVNLNRGTLRIFYELLSDGNWSLPIMQFGTLGERFDSSRLNAFLPLSQQRCKNAQTSISYSGIYVFLNVAVTPTGIPCATNYPDRTGVLVAVIVALALAFVLGVALIITCLIKPVKKKTWKKWEK